MSNRILVIDDDPIAMRLVEYTLKQRGYQVITAQNGLEGLLIAQKEVPDLIVLNIMLPGIDGFEACHRLRTDTTTAQIPILILSGRSQQKDKETGFKMGANDYLTKPAAPSEIITRVESLLVRKPVANSKMIAFFSSKNGAGTTTTVVNLSIALSQAGKRVIAVDLCPNGGIAEHIGVKPQDATAHLLETPMDSLDRGDLESALATHQTGVGVLNILDPDGKLENTSPSNMELLFDRLRDVSDYCLVDLPFQPTVISRAALMKCDIAIIVSNCTPDALNEVKSVVTALRFLGISPERIGIVITDTKGIFHEMELASIKSYVEANVGVSLFGVIPYEAQASLEPSSVSTPLILSNPNCPMIYAIKQLAEQIISEERNKKESSRTGVKGK